MVMETYTSPLVSTHPYSQDYNYNNITSSLQNLDLGHGVFGNQESCSRYIDHGGFDASRYSCFSPKPQCGDQSSAVQGPQLLDHTTWPNQSNGEPFYAPVTCVPRSFVDTNTFSDQERMRINIGPGYPWMHNEAIRVPGISMAGDTAPAYHPSYMGGCTMNQNGYFGQGFTQPRSNDQNGYHNQGFTETRSNDHNGYGNQEFTERSNGVSVQSPASKTNPQDFVSMAMRNEGLMCLQNSIVVELALCMRILNKILCQALPQLEAKKAVPRDGQQTPNRISGSVQGSPGPTIPTRIFVGGLASTVTESDFKTYFDQFGTITNVEVKYDHITQRTRGFGFISFDSEKAVEKVLRRTSFHELKGKMVEVKRAVPKDLYQKSIRRQLGGLSYGLSKVSNLLSAYSQGYSPSFTPGYGLGPNLEPAGHPVSDISCIGGGGGIGSLFNSINRDTRGNGSFNFAKNSTNSAEFMGSGSGNTGFIRNAYSEVAPGNAGEFAYSGHHGDIF